MGDELPNPEIAGFMGSKIDPEFSATLATLILRHHEEHLQ